MINPIILLVCLSSYLIERYSDQTNWALCPESTNCICPKNITITLTRPKCMEPELLEEFCGPVRSSSLQNINLFTFDYIPFDKKLFVTIFKCKLCKLQAFSEIHKANDVVQESIYALPATAPSLSHEVII